MAKNRWRTWALVATLFAVVLIPDAFVLMRFFAESLAAQAREAPPARPWYYALSPIVIQALSILPPIVAGVAAHAWGKAGRKRPAPAAPPAADDEEADDRPMAPPGFIEAPKVRKKRHGLGPLLGFTFLGLALLAIGAVTVLFGINNIVAAIGRTSMSTANLMTQLVLFAGIPALTLGGLFVGLAWGRWFPLGQLEIITETRQEAKPATNFNWQQEI